MHPVSNQALSQLRCSVCKEYLSRFPIYWYPEREDVVCGRCPVLSDQNPTRNLSYEALAKHLCFPCCYNLYGCTILYSPTEMEEHEKSCMYKRYVCPFMPPASCHWQGAAYELFEHYQQEHGSFALTNPIIELDLEKPINGNYLLVYFDRLFLINVELDEDSILWFGLRSIGDNKKNQDLMYMLEIKRPGYEGCITLPRSLVCSDFNMFLKNETASQIPINQILAILGDSEIILLSLSIFCRSNDTDSGLQTSNHFIQTEGKDLDEDLLKQLVCPKCKDHMVPPISQCAKGHSLCSACEHKLTYCYVCSSRFYYTRNYNLEKMTEYINYHCKYRDSGCSFVSNSKVIKEHESDECKYASFVCPLSSHSLCTWNGDLSKIMKHVREEHEKYVLDGNTLTWSYKDEDNEEVETDCFVIEHMGNVFKVIFRYDSREFFWCVQLVSVKKEAANFMFELDFVDNSGKEQRFTTRLSCGRYLLDNEEGMPTGTYLKQTYKMLSHLMSKESGLTYWCHIIKKNC